MYETQCEIAYGVCAVHAEAQVKAYYNETGPSLDTLVQRYASDYEAGSFGRDGAESGCLGALMDEYRMLYG